MNRKRESGELSLAARYRARSPLVPFISHLCAPVVGRAIGLCIFNHTL